MYVEIYADIVFLINLVMDFFIFWAVSKIIRRRIHIIRLVIGSFFAALLYCSLIFIPPLQKFLNIFCVPIILIISIFITFSPKNILDLVKITVLTNVIAVAIGGACMSLFYFTGVQSFLTSASIKNFSVKMLISVTCISYVCIKAISWWVNKITIKRQLFYPVRIYMKQKNLELNALVDTGNSLRDPISSYPVVIAEFSKIKAFLPDSICSLFYEKKENDLVEVMSRASESYLFNRIRMIPFNSVGAQNGILIGFKPDGFEIINEHESIRSNNVIIGIYNYKLSSDGSYQALLCPDMLNKQ